MPLHHGRHPRRRRDGEEPGRRPVRGGRVRGRPLRRDAARRELALRPARLRPPRRGGRRRLRAPSGGRGAIDDAEVAAAAAELDRFLGDRRRPVRAPRRAAADDAAQRRHLPRQGGADHGRRGDRAAEGARARGRAAAAAPARVQSRLAPLDGPPQHARRAPRRSRARRSSETESRGAHSRLDYPEPSRSGAAAASSAARTATRWRSTRSRSSPWTSSRRSSRTAAHGSRCEHAGVRALARRRGRRRVRRLRGRGGRGHGRARRGARDPADVGAGSRRALELQGGEVRLVRRRGERQAAADVQDAARRPARRPPRPRRPAARVPGHPRPRQRRVVELRGEQAHPAVRAERRTPSG